VLFPGGGESPTFPQVRLGCPGLWSAIFGILISARRALGVGLCWRFSNFRFGGTETGSTADRDWFAECPSGIGCDAGAESTSLEDSFFHYTMVFELAARRCLQAITSPRDYGVFSRGQARRSNLLLAACVSSTLSQRRAMTRIGGLMALFWPQSVSGNFQSPEFFGRGRPQTGAVINALPCGAAMAKLGFERGEIEEHR
jgi:hypothetical protein